MSELIDVETREALLASLLNRIKAIVPKIPDGEDVEFTLNATGGDTVRLSVSVGYLPGTAAPERIAALRTALSPGMWAKKLVVESWTEYTEYTRSHDGVSYLIRHYGIPQTCKVITTEVEEMVEVDEILQPAITRKVKKLVTKTVKKTICGPDNEEA